MIRPAVRNDIIDLAELSSRAFPGERSVNDRIRQLESGGTWGGVEATWVDERAGCVVGTYRALPLTQHMHGVTFRTMGLAAVAVDEGARRRGVGRDLCTHALRTARERGDVLSMLFPFRPAFYHALGWGFVGEMHAHRFRPEALPLHDGRVQRAAPDDSAAIEACYARVAAEGNGLLERPPRAWRQHLSDGVHTWVTGSPEVQGYMIVRYGRAASPDERPMHVRELVAENQEAYRALLGWVAAQRDAVRVVHYEAVPDEKFTHLLNEPRPPGYHLARALWSPVSRVIRGPMLRIVDVKAALEQRRRWPAHMPPLRFGIHVNDEVLTENAGPWVVDFERGRATVTRGTASPLLRIDAAAFAQVYAGELTAREAVRLGFAECDTDISVIDGLFRVDRCFRLLDEF